MTPDAFKNKINAAMRGREGFRLVGGPCDIGNSYQAAIHFKASPSGLGGSYIVHVANTYPPSNTFGEQSFNDKQVEHTPDGRRFETNMGPFPALGTITIPQLEY